MQQWRRLVFVKIDGKQANGVHLDLDSSQPLGTAYRPKTVNSLQTVRITYRLAVLRLSTVFCKYAVSKGPWTFEIKVDPICLFSVIYGHRNNWHLTVMGLPAPIRTWSYCSSSSRSDLIFSRPRFSNRWCLREFGWSSGNGFLKCFDSMTNKPRKIVSHLRYVHELCSLAFNIICSNIYINVFLQNAANIFFLRIQGNDQISDSRISYVWIGMWTVPNFRNL